MGGNGLVNWIHKHRHILFIVVILLICVSLCFQPWNCILKIPAVNCLKDNLDFIGNFIIRYPWLSIVIIIACIFFLLTDNFSLSSTKIIVFGMEFQLKHTERNAKLQIKNYLSSKRSIFVFYKEYDNYYDVINSMYDTLIFLRNQLKNFDVFSQTSNKCYKQIEGMIKTIGQFLTKYQSDYRRYYEYKAPEFGEEFIPFKNIQDNYCKISDMTIDIQKLNMEMKQYAIFFNIDTEKWKNWY